MTTTDTPWRAVSAFESGIEYRIEGKEALALLPADDSELFELFRSITVRKIPAEDYELAEETAMENKMRTSFIDHREEGENSYSLVLGLSGPVTDIDRAVDAANLEVASWEMTGYFWQSFVQYLWPELAEQVNFDCEAGMFCAYGSEPEPLRALQDPFDAVLSDPALVVETIIRGQAEGQDLY